MAGLQGVEVPTISEKVTKGEREKNTSGRR
jgi:hypothetical protein